MDLRVQEAQHVLPLLAVLFRFPFQAQTEQLRATIEAQMKADVSATKMTMNIAEKKAQQEIQAIADSMHVAKEKAMADAQFYSAKKESEGNSLLLTDSYLEFMHIQRPAVQCGSDL